MKIYLFSQKYVIVIVHKKRRYVTIIGIIRFSKYWQCNLHKSNRIEYS